MTKLNPIRILLVEDFHVETEVIELELRDAELPHEITVVKNEKAYRSQLISFRPDVILSPYSLRGTNAIKLLGIARKLKIDVPFILLAFDLSEDIAIDLLAEGIEDYVQPSTLKRLPITIRKALQRHKIQIELMLSEQRLKTSEAALRNMVRNAPIAVAMFDRNMNYLEISSFWLSHERKTEEIIGKNHYDVVPEIPDSWKTIHQKVLSGETHGSEREKMTRVDGSIEVFRWKMNPWYNPDGEIGGAVLFIEDLSEKEITHSKLEKTAQSLSEAQQIAKIGSWSLDLVTNGVQWSSEMFTIHGIEKQPLSLELIRNLTHPEDLNLFDEALKTLVGGTNTNIVYRVINPKSKDIRYLRGKGRVLQNPDGSIIDLSGTVQDITEPYLTSLDLRKSEASLKMAQQIAKIGSWEWNKNDKHVSVSDEIYAIYEINKKPLTINDIRSFIHPDDQKRVVGLATNDLSGSITPVINYRINTAKGNEKFVVSSAKQVTDNDGRVVGLAGTLQDATESVSLQILLQEKERLLTEMAESINDVFWITNSEGDQVLYMSPKYSEIYGKSMESIYADGNSWADNIHPDDKPTVFQEWAENRLNGKFEVEYRINHPDGHTKWLHAKAFPVKNRQGEVVRLAGITRDITEKRKIETSLRESELLFRQMAENIDGVFYLTDWVNGEVLYTSPLYESVYELSLAELHNDARSWRKVVYPDDLGLLLKTFKENAPKGTFDHEFRLLMKDGRIKWLRDRSFPIKDSNGLVVRMAGITEDITEQKKILEKIKSLSLVASETVNGVLIHDAEGKTLWTNKGFTTITGYELEELIGKEPWSVLEGSNTNQKLVEFTYQKIREGKPFSSDNQLLHKDGSSRWVHTTFTPILDSKGDITQIVSIGTDISKQKELEELQRTMLVRMEHRVKERTAELEEKNLELRKEIWENQRISDELYHNNLDLKDSIEYAKRIQESILPDVSLLKKSFSHGFIVFLPRDVVSGDFYWYFKRSNLSYFAAIDCTGHGVPGALMSMIANELMNQSDPAEIVTALNKLMIRTLRQRDETNMRDGMDLSLIVVDHSKNELSFCGALSSMYLCRNNELEFYPGNRHSVGGHLEDVQKEFTTTMVSISKGDTVYLSTDGYIDQFGGPEGKKLMKKRFATLLKSVQDLPMDEQKTKLLQKFEDWKGPLNQVDDVLLVGLRY